MHVRGLSRDKENAAFNQHIIEPLSVQKEGRRRQHSRTKSIPKSERIQKSKIETSLYEIINFLSAYGVVVQEWNQYITNENFRVLKSRIEKLFKNVFTDKERNKIKLIKAILDHQITFQEEALTKVLKKQAVGNKKLEKERITQDAIIILNEISENDLNMSSTSYAEAKYYENYEDPDFQNLIELLKRLWKREKMLVTIMNQRVTEIEDDKESVEQALLDFMNKSSVPIMNSSNLEDSYLCKNIQTLRNVNSKLLLDNDWALESTKNQIEQTSTFSKSDNKQLSKFNIDYESQVHSLLKAMSRCEKIIEEKESLISKHSLIFL